MARHVIALYTGQCPEGLKFRRSRNGKPELQDQKYPLRFNVTHTGGVVLVAVRKNGLLGIDAEVIRDFGDMGEVAADFFSTKELHLLRDCNAYERTTVFFQLWTGKEACIKAVGGEISNVGLKRIDLSRAALKRSHFQCKPTRYLRWFTPLSGVIAAVACDARPRAIRFFQWRGSRSKA